MKERKGPEEESRDGQTEIKEDIAQVGVVIEIGNPVLDRRHHSGIDSNEDTNHGGAQASNRCYKPLPDSRPVSGDWLPLVSPGQAEALVASNTDMWFSP